MLGREFVRRIDHIGKPELYVACLAAPILYERNQAAFWVIERAFFSGNGHRLTLKEFLAGKLSAREVRAVDKLRTIIHELLPTLPEEVRGSFTRSQIWWQGKGQGK